MQAVETSPSSRWSARLARALTGLAFAPLQALYLAGLLGLLVGLAAFRALGPLGRAPRPG